MMTSAGISKTAPPPALSGPDILIEARDLKGYFPVKKGLLSRVVGYVKAVNGVSFSVRRSETFGLVGETACGKSTTARLIVGLYKPTGGNVLFQGQSVSAMKEDQLRRLRRQVQMVFQDPYSSLNPRMTAGEIIAEPLHIYGEGTKKQRLERVAELLDLVGLDQHQSRRYPHEFSGGQRQRIGIARAIALNPAVVVCDEPVSALDVSIQSQILNLLEDLQSRLHLTYIFISHDLSVVRHVCDRVAVMYLGKIVELGTRDEIFEKTVHPYTRALLSAVPLPDPGIKKERLLLKGEVPSPLNPPQGCQFHPRCPHRGPECSEKEPPFQWLGETHAVACFLAQ